MYQHEFDQQKVESICDIIADTSNGLTGRELQHLLDLCSVPYDLPIAPNKRQWFFNCLAYKFNREQSQYLFKDIIEKTVNLARYTDFDNREQYEYLVNGINKVLLLEGYEINTSGIIVEVEKADTLDEVDRRANEREAKFQKQNFHPSVVHLAKKEYVNGQYFEAVFEASKGLSKKVRELTGLTGDGANLFEKAFSTKNPYLVLNRLETETERNEQNGLRTLINAIFLMFRNPQAHNLKLDWPVNEVKALDALSLISFAFKGLDQCQVVKRD
ncbi:TIGR02391 family protein [Allobaculum sp. JKK-2023]|uniref:TIGR02391 family protein n=1 Tax=Allobaculum sp. JKK-2023 TaxID=3108943 RepID=UPI002B058759|nr:TIGR02391 family protein [Allobaculum sp. JKK-2023]